MAHRRTSPPKDRAMKKLLFLATAVAGTLAVLKKQRDAELDEAIWEEPRDL